MTVARRVGDEALVLPRRKFSCTGLVVPFPTFSRATNHVPAVRTSGTSRTRTVRWSPDDSAREASDVAAPVHHGHAPIQRSAILPSGVVDIWRPASAVEGMRFDPGAKARRAG